MEGGGRPGEGASRDRGKVNNVFHLVIRDDAAAPKSLEPFSSGRFKRGHFF